MRGERRGKAMRQSGRRILLAAVTLSVAARVCADDANLTLTDGTRFSFELVRSAGQSRTELGSGVASGKGVGYRLLFDWEALRFFGYAVKATPVAAGRFRLEVGPLTSEVLERLAKTVRPDGRQLVGESLAIEYPPPVEVGADEPLLLELMVNPTTGEKLSDVIRITAETKASPGPHRLAVKAAVLKVNGVTQPWSGGASGRYVYFALPGRGRFVVSLDEDAGYSFAPATLEGNRTVTFAAEGDTYEWTSAEPVVATAPVPERLWVWHDATFSFGGRCAIGAFEALPRQ